MRPYLSCYWPDFDQTLKCRFLGPSLTDFNCHDDICPGNICPGDLCPYQEYLSCHWPDFETSLANYYPFTLDNLRQLSNWHFSMQHLSWRHLSILAISQLLLARFWPNFKGGFLGHFLTYSKCHNDICSGNICPCDICPYQQYLSFCWPDFDQILKVGSWDLF